MEDIEVFIDQIIDAKGYTTLEDDVRATLRADMAQRLMDQIDRAAINALPEDKAIELSERLDKEDMSDEEIGNFIAESGVDLQKIAVETAIRFRQLYLGGGLDNEADTSLETASTTAGE